MSFEFLFSSNGKQELSLIGNNHFSIQLQSNTKDKIVQCIHKNTKFDAVLFTVTRGTLDNWNNTPIVKTT